MRFGLLSSPASGLTPEALFWPLGFFPSAFVKSTFSASPSPSSVHTYSFPWTAFRRNKPSEGARQLICTVTKIPKKKPGLTVTESAHCQLTVTFRSIAKLLSSWRLGSREKRVQGKCALQGHTLISTDSPHTNTALDQASNTGTFGQISCPSQTRAWPAPTTDFSPGEGQRRCHTRSEQRKVCAFVQKSPFKGNVRDKHAGL